MEQLQFFVLFEGWNISIFYLVGSYFVNSRFVGSICHAPLFSLLPSFLLESRHRPPMHYLPLVWALPTPVAVACCSGYVALPPACTAAFVAPLATCNATGFIMPPPSGLSLTSQNWSIAGQISLSCRHPNRSYVARFTTAYLWEPEFGLVTAQRLGSGLARVARSRGS